MSEARLFPLPDLRLYRGDMITFDEMLERHN